MVVRTTSSLQKTRVPVQTPTLDPLTPCHRERATMRSLLSRIACLGLAIVVIGSGCNGGRPPVDTSTTEATITGTVKIRGKPVTEGKVSFDPSNVARKWEPARTATIGKD